MDQSKAFDAPPRTLLIAKLKAYNVWDQACEMVKCYVSMRSQRVKIDIHKSGWKWLQKGIFTWVNKWA